MTLPATQPTWPLPADAALEQKIDALMATMTVEEKIGQAIQGDISTITPADLHKYRLGSILTGGGSDPGNVYNAEPQAWTCQMRSGWNRWTPRAAATRPL